MSGKPQPRYPRLDEWLGRRRSSGEVLLGNNFPGNGESTSGESKHTAARHGNPPALPGRFSTMER